MMLSTVVCVSAILALAAVATAAEPSPAPAPSPAPSPSPNWPAFMADQDFVWSSEDKGGIKPGFYNGAFLGDGVTGGMIFRDAEAPQTLRWLMGRYDVIAHSSIPKLEYCVPRLFAGDILLTPAGTVQKETMRLSLYDAQASGEIQTDRGTLSWRAYMHRTEHVYVVVVKGDGEKDASLRVREQWGISPVLYKKKLDPAQFAGHLPPRPTTETRGEVTLITQPLKANAAHAVAWTILQPEPGTRILLATIGAAHDRKQPVEVSVAAAQREALDRLAAVRSVPLATLDQTHQAWWHQHIQRSRLELPDDPAWEAFWWRQIYKFASASAEDSSLLIDNEGPWAWDCDWGAIWWNLNVQLSYFPTFSANRLDVGRSLINGMDRIYRSGALNRNAGKFSADSVWIGRSTDISGDGSWGDEAGNLTWVLHNCWRYWKHSGDDAIGRWMFPILKADVNWYLHQLKEASDGKLHLPPTRSPEYENVRNPRGLGDLMPDTNYALASLHWGLKTLLAMDQELKLNDPMRQRWLEVQKQLVDLPKGEHGLKIAAEQEYDGSHRHYSHLLAIYPYHTINPDQGPEARELIQKSVDRWTSMPQAFAGYSYTGACAMYATLGEGDKAIAWADKLLKRVHPNTIYDEGGGQVIETPLSAVEAINYLLLQSWGDTIRVFPAVPSRWKNVRFDDFSAEGAFLVSAERKDGQNLWVSVRSLKGGPLRLQPNLAGPFTIQAPEGANAVAANGLVQATLAPGQELRIRVKNR